MEAISIIIPCYNASAFIGRALQKAREQTYPELEIIVVDDGSNAATKTELKRLGAYMDLLITQGNRGQGAARNNGIAKATGTYILNWDADDYFEPSFCDEAAAIMETDKNVKIVTCQAWRTDGRESKELITPQGGSCGNFLFENAALGSAMFRRVDWEAAGGYDESQVIRGFEDWEFYLNILKKGGVAHVIQKPLFNYFRHPHTTTHAIRNQRLEKQKFIMVKHAELYKRHYLDLIDDLFMRLEREEREKIKNTQRIDFKLGKILLQPVRLLKKLFK